MRITGSNHGPGPCSSVKKGPWKTLPSGRNLQKSAPFTRRLTGLLVAVWALAGLSTAHARAEIHLYKEGVPQTPVAGEMFTYHMRVENVGVEDAENVLVTDTLPEGMTYVGDTGFCTLTNPETQTFECRPAGNAFTSPPYVLPAGEAVEFDVIVDLDPGLLGDITNLASVSIDNSEFSITSFGDDVTVQSVADAVIYKFAATDTVYAGEQMDYAIVVDNWGPSNFWDPIVKDTLFVQGTDPDRFFVDANGCSLSVRSCGGLIDEFDCNFATSTGIFELATMGANFLTPLGNAAECADAGEEDPEAITGRMIMTINLTAETAGQLTNTVTVYSGDGTTTDPDTSNNTTTVVSYFEALADLSVTKSVPADPEYLVVGLDEITYRIDVSNGGPSPADNVVLLDNLPAGVSLVEAVVDELGTDCIPGTPGDATDPLRCNLGRLESVQNPEPGPEPTMMTVFVTVAVDSNFPVDPLTCTGSLTNTAWVVSQTIDLNNSNDASTISTDVSCDPGLEATKTGYGRVITGYTGDGEAVFAEQEGAVTAGEQIRFNIQVANTGPSPAFDVVVTDTLQSGLSYISSEGAACAPVGIGQYACSLGDLYPGDSVSFNIFALVDDAANGQIDNCINVQSVTEFVSYCLSDEGREIEVQEFSNLSVQKWADADVYDATSTVTYTIEVTNNGPAALSNIMVRDYLPTDKLARYYFDSCGSNWSGKEDKDIDWTIPYLAAGASHSCNVYVTVSGSRGCIRNAVAVSGDKLLGTPGDVSGVADDFLTDNRDYVDVLIQGRKFYPASPCENPPAFEDALSAIATNEVGESGLIVPGDGGGGGNEADGQGRPGSVEDALGGG